MTRRLILIRHAKSGWDDPLADDHARVLTARGREAAQTIGAWLLTQDALPDMILTSDAARARETTEHLCKGLTQTPAILQDPRLYHAAPDTITDICARRSEATIAVVAHNPGMGMLAQMLASARPDHHRFDDYPTCATTILSFTNTTWMQYGKGAILNFTIPRDLT